MNWLIEVQMANDTQNKKCTKIVWVWIDLIFGTSENFLWLFESRHVYTKNELRSVLIDITLQVSF